MSERLEAARAALLATQALAGKVYLSRTQYVRDLHDQRLHNNDVRYNEARDQADNNYHRAYMSGETPQEHAARSSVWVEAIQHASNGHLLELQESYEILEQALSAALQDFRATERDAASIYRVELDACIEEGENPWNGGT